MTFAAGVVTISGDDLERLGGLLFRAGLDGASLRIALDGGVVVKLGEGAWSAPYGVLDRDATDAAADLP